jgi:hypothetical protein
MSMPAGWHADPGGVFDHRWWDGDRWTEHVAVRGVAGVSPIGTHPVDARLVASALAEVAASGADGTTAPPPPPRRIAATTRRAPAHPVPPFGDASPAAPAARSAGTSADDHAAHPTGGIATAPRADDGADARDPTGAVADDAYVVRVVPPRVDPDDPDTPPPPGGTAPLRSSTATPVVDRWMWTIVAVAAAWATATALGSIPLALTPLVTLSAALANGVLAHLDLRANPDLTAHTSRVEMMLWAVLLMPVYLWKRQRRLGRGLGPFWLHLLVGVAAVAVAVGAALGSTIDDNRLESQIEGAIAEQAGVLVQVDCPEYVPAVPGYTFSCVLASEVGTARIDAEVIDDRGAVEWAVVE